MIKVSKVSALVLIFYILFYLQIWGDNHLVLYGSACISVVSILLHCFYTGKLYFSSIPFGIWNNLIIVAYSLATGFFVAYDYATAVHSSVTMAAYSAVCIAICYVSVEEKSFDWVLKGLIGLAVLCALYTLFFGVVREGYGKVLSATNNPHSLATVMNLGIFSVAYLAKKNDKKNTIISSILILLFLYCIIGSGSRKYLIVSAFIVVIWVWASFKERWKKGNNQQRIAAIMICLAAVFVAVFLYNRVFANSYSFSRMIQQDDDGTQNRIRFYSNAVTIFADHPLFGGGFDQFQFWSGAGCYAHSTYAEAIADFGLAGSLLYFIPLLYTIFSAIHYGLSSGRDYQKTLLLALCFAELFLGIGQVFFMEFSHFITWTILHYKIYQLNCNRREQHQKLESTSKYVRTKRTELTYTSRYIRA